MIPVRLYKDTDYPIRLPFVFSEQRVNKGILILIEANEKRIRKFLNIISYFHEEESVNWLYKLMAGATLIKQMCQILFEKTSEIKGEPDYETYLLTMMDFMDETINKYATYEAEELEGLQMMINEKGTPLILSLEEYCHTLLDREELVTSYDYSLNILNLFDCSLIVLKPAGSGLGSIQIPEGTASRHGAEYASYAVLEYKNHIYDVENGKLKIPVETYLRELQDVPNQRIEIDKRLTTCKIDLDKFLS